MWELCTQNEHFYSQNYFPKLDQSYRSHEILFMYCNIFQPIIIDLGSTNHNRSYLDQS